MFRNTTSVSQLTAFFEQRMAEQVVENANPSSKVSEAQPVTVVAAPAEQLSTVIPTLGVTPPDIRLGKSIDSIRLDMVTAAEALQKSTSNVETDSPLYSSFLPESFNKMDAISFSAMLVIRRNSYIARVDQQFKQSDYNVVNDAATFASHNGDSVKKPKRIEVIHTLGSATVTLATYFVNMNLRLGMQPIKNIELLFDAATMERLLELFKFSPTITASIQSAMNLLSEEFSLAGNASIAIKEFIETNKSNLLTDDLFAQIFKMTSDFMMPIKSALTEDKTWDGRAYIPATCDDVIEKIVMAYMNHVLNELFDALLYNRDKQELIPDQLEVQKKILFLIFVLTAEAVAKGKSEIDFDALVNDYPFMKLFLLKKQLVKLEELRVTCLVSYRNTFSSMIKRVNRKIKNLNSSIELMQDLMKKLDLNISTREMSYRVHVESARDDWQTHKIRLINEKGIHGAEPVAEYIYFENMYLLVLEEEMQKHALAGLPLRNLKHIFENIVLNNVSRYERAYDDAVNLITIPATDVELKSKKSIFLPRLPLQHLPKLDLKSALSLDSPGSSSSSRTTTPSTSARSETPTSSGSRTQLYSEAQISPTSQNSEKRSSFLNGFLSRSPSNKLIVTTSTFELPMAEVESPRFSKKRNLFSIRPSRSINNNGESPRSPRPVIAGLSKDSPRANSELSYHLSTDQLPLFYANEQSSGLRNFFGLTPRSGSGSDSSREPASPKSGSSTPHTPTANAGEPISPNTNRR